MVNDREQWGAAEKIFAHYKNVSLNETLGQNMRPGNLRDFIKHYLKTKVTSMPYKMSS